MRRIFWTQHLAILLVMGLASFLLFQNCSQTPFGTLGLSATELSSSDDTENVVSVPYALLSAEQVFKSMESVTGTEPSAALMKEYNNRQSVLGSGYDLKLVTSPMLMSISNLAGGFCNETLAREAAQPTDQRKFFRQIDFSRGPASLSPFAYQDTVGNLASAFWGRSLSSEELTILEDSKSEFLAALTSSEQSKAASTRNLMLFTCTGMLSSFDSISF